MLQDPPGEYRRLGGGQNQPYPRRPQLPQQGGDTGIHLVFENARLRKIFPVMDDGGFRLSGGKPILLHKGIPQGRADKGIERSPIFHQNPLTPQRVLHRFGDPLGGIGQGAVQIPEQIPLVLHRKPSVSYHSAAIIQGRTAVCQTVRRTID